MFGNQTPPTHNIVNKANICPINIIYLQQLSVPNEHNFVHKEAHVSLCMFVEVSSSIYKPLHRSNFQTMDEDTDIIATCNPFLFVSRFIGCCIHISRMHTHPKVSIRAIKKSEHNNLMYGSIISLGKYA